jgi:hypothetical protein
MFLLRSCLTSCFINISFWFRYIIYKCPTAPHLSRVYEYLPRNLASGKMKGNNFHKKKCIVFCIILVQYAKHNFQFYAVKLGLFINGSETYLNHFQDVFSEGVPWKVKSS